MGKKSPFLTRFERFRTVAQVWIHRWLWNDAQSLTWYRRGALFFSRSSIKFQGHTGQKKITNLDPNWVFRDFNSSLNSPNGNGFEIMHKAWRTIEEVYYCFVRSFIKFQGHAGWKIDDNLIWVRLLGRSQLSIPQICLVYSMITKMSHERSCWQQINIDIGNGMEPSRCQANTWTMTVDDESSFLPLDHFNSLRTDKP